MPTIDAQDRAIDHEIDDRLNRLPFIENLIRALIIEERDLTGKVIKRHSAGVVIGLTGSWGSGKSSVLNLLSARLKKLDHVAVATFNPWLFKGRDELVTAFFNELRDALGKSIDEHGRSLIEALNRYQWAINGAAHVGAAVADLHGGGGAFTLWKRGALKKLNAPRVEKLKPLSPQQERASLEKKLDEKRIAVVVLIDELDRVEDDDVRAVAQLVKAVGDIKGISYLVAYDPDRVAEALGSGVDPYRRGAAYLEKIIQHPIPLRPLFTNDVDALLKAALENHGVRLTLPVQRDEISVFENIKSEISTPREIKRLIGTYGILEPMVRGEISEIDILAYCWMIIKSEPIRKALAAHFDRIVDDPSQEEMVARYSRNSSTLPSPEDALGSAAKEFDSLLKFLFPRFGRSHDGETGHRISKRRNLVRLLYLGDPPGITSRSEVERLYEIRDLDELTNELREALHTGRLSGIIDRLEDLLPSLPPQGDTYFWLAVARVLVRESDWLTGAEINGALLDDAATYLMRFGIKSKSNAERVKHVLETLMAHGDLAIVPWLLRKHLFIFGLTEVSVERGGESVWSKSETKTVLNRELPRYRAALESGFLLRRLPSLEALMVIHNVGDFDKQMRDALTEQMSDPQARATFAGLLVPPGYGVQQGELEKYFDVPTVLRLMEESQQGLNPQGSWLERSLARLRRSLSGKSILGWDGQDDDPVPG